MLPANGRLRITRTGGSASQIPQRRRATGLAGTAVWSTGTRKRDETIKKQLYERSGAQEYWIADPEIDVVRVHRRESGKFMRPIELSREHGDVLRSPLFPGLDLPLERVFRDT